MTIASAGDSRIALATRETTVDVHAHFLPPMYREALRSAGLTLLDGGIPTPDWSIDRALALMDATGIHGAVLSVSSPHASFLPPDRAPALCRAINDYAADVARRHPDRFAAYAILPLPEVGASLAELAHALEQLQLDGVALPTNAAGKYLGDAEFEPLLAALDDRATTVFVHPTSPQCFEAFGLQMPAPMIEFPFDTTRTVVSLLYSGALLRYPRIRWILPHAGGTLPFLAPRIAAVGSMPFLRERAIGAEAAQALLAGLHYDTALSVTQQQIGALLAMVGSERVVYGTDYPFAPAAIVQANEARFESLGLADTDRQRIRSGNAFGLFEAFSHRCCRGVGHAG